MVLPAILDEYREAQEARFPGAKRRVQAEACGQRRTRSGGELPVTSLPVPGPSDYWLHVRSAGQDKPVVHSVPVWETMSGHQASMQQFIRAIRVA